MSGIQFSVSTISDQEIFHEVDCDLCLGGGITFWNSPPFRLEQIRV